MDDLTGWLDEVSSDDSIWFVKRLSGNDTLANESHQAGPYVPKALMFAVIPTWIGQTGSNQKSAISVSVDSHDQHCMATATWYNNRYRGGTRNETRLTGFGGASAAPLDPENTGSIAFFAFRTAAIGAPIACRLWIARMLDEEVRIESLVGPVEPGKPLVRRLPSGSSLSSDELPLRSRGACWLERSEVPESWFQCFPTGLELARLAFERIPTGALSPDARLLKRRECEAQAFFSIEEAVELDGILEGFTDIDSFIEKAKSMTQRRLSRAGRSLELHTRQILEEEGMHAGASYSWQAKVELGKKPDFLFPSVDAYNDTSYPACDLRMLAVKTTCKDRWRQVINEADRIERKHLLTLQEGVSIHQFEEMQSEGIELVVPGPLRNKFNKSIRHRLITLADFLADVRALPTH